jgi:hypothetical protein
MSADRKMWFEPRGRGLWPVSAEGWLLSLCGVLIMFLASVAAVRLALAGDVATIVLIAIGAFAVSTIFLLVAARRTRWRRSPG